ncbi:MAG: histidine kinase [Mobilitalea sp.]
MKVNKKESARSTYSFRHRIFLIVALIFISFILIITWLSSYFTNILREKSYNNIKDTLQLYNNQLSENLEDIDIYLFEMNYNSSDISMINTQKDVSKVYNNIMRVKDLLDYSLPSFSEIGGIFVYAPRNDTYIQSYKQTENAPVSNYIRDYLRKLNSGGAMDQVNTDTWFSQEVKNSYYLIRIIKIDNSYIGTWANVDELTSTFQSVSDLKGNVMYVDSNGMPLSENEFSNYTFNLEPNLNNYTIFKPEDGDKSLMVTSEITYCDYYLVALIPLKNIDVDLYTIYEAFIILILVIIVLVISLIISVNKFLSKPILLLENAATSIRSGNFDTKVPSDNSNCKEIIQIDTAFNNMIEEIQELRIDVYEEKISKSQIELQYLKSQIAPHFLINCLFSISSLADSNSENHEILQKMVATLSDHLRYTLSDRTKVPLEEELSYIYNYMELTKLRFPGFLTYISKIAPETKDASVFPLILLMFTENTIKYNMVMGEPLLVSITSEMMIKNEEKWIHIIHIDSGDGFDSDTLADLSEGPNHTSTHQDGRHLGIRNVAKRLELVYGDTATIRFSNEPGSGARIDIEIPYATFS